MATKNFETYIAGIEEEAAYKKWPEADGRKVWDSNTLDNQDNTEEWKDKKTLSTQMVSPEEYSTAQKERQKEIWEIAKGKLDWPPAKGNPESEARIARDLEGQLNTVV